MGSTGAFAAPLSGHRGDCGFGRSRACSDRYLIAPGSDARCAEVTGDRASEWLRRVYLMLTLRDDLDTAGEHALITDFVLPSLIVHP